MIEPGEAAARVPIFHGILCATLGFCGCSEAGEPAVLARFDASAAAGFYDAPFPIAHRERPNGSLRVADFPNASQNDAVAQIVELLETGSSGFSPHGAVLVPFDGAIDAARLPADARASLEPESNVFLVNVEPDSARRGERVPIETSFRSVAGPHAPAHLLVALPYQGAGMEPQTSYALVVRRALGDADGRALYAPDALVDVLSGFAPPGEHGAALRDAFEPLREWLAEAAVDPGQVAAATVFRTGDPLAETIAWRDQVASMTAPPVDGLRAIATHEGYCAIAVATSLPLFQQGDKPYTAPGSGRIAIENGRPIEQGRDALEIVVTVPHGPMPARGFPLVVYLPSAGASAGELLDRTAESRDPAQGLGPPGRGPALHYAARGIGALAAAPPLSGERNPGDGLEDFWNPDNLGALRDNLRQGVLEVTALLSLAETLTIDASLCPEAQSSEGLFRYDTQQLFLHGHGTGGLVAAASIALEPSPRAAVLAGTGGSWILELAEGQAPVQQRLAETLGLAEPGDRFHPVLSLLEAAFAPVEPMSWGRASVAQPIGTPKQLLLVEGVVDSHHPPRQVNAYAMSAGLDLVQPEIEPTAREDYELVGRSVLPAPISGNVSDAGMLLTAAAIQRSGDGRDGHLVTFEHDDVKYRYACFLASIAGGEPGLVAAPESDALAPCP